MISEIEAFCAKQGFISLQVKNSSKDCFMREYDKKIGFKYKRQVFFLANSKTAHLWFFDITQKDRKEMLKWIVCNDFDITIHYPLNDVMDWKRSILSVCKKHNIDIIRN